MSPPAIRGFELQRAELPLGRVIGDNDCRYDSMSVVALRLRTDDGDGWGYGDAVSHAIFNRPAWYLEPLPELADLSAAFEAKWWPRLDGRAAAEVQVDSLRHADPLAQAVDLALWDLRGKALGVPVWSLLADEDAPRSVPAYGSLLDFPSSDEAAVALARSFAARGFSALKVKVGALERGRDVARLVAVREAVGPEVELTADANGAWEVRETLARLAAFDAAGVRLGYLEDALPYDDLEGFAQLAAATDVPLVAHDYAPDLAAAEALLATGGVDRLRVGAGGITGMLRLAGAARAAGRRMIAGNTLFEHGAQVAVAFDGFDRLEFSDLAWNDVLLDPVQFEGGVVVPPHAPGLGLDPRPGALEELARER
jgi:L-alanine-DL-glutamate epimerase-like enolase superfamily enzyme